jgi:hypothetical protein
MWGLVWVWSIMAVLAAIWVAAIYYRRATPPSAFLPLPPGK